MIALQRWIYCSALLVWVLWVALFPTWVGRSYHRFDNSDWRENGVFGLYGSQDGFTIHSPLWNPPNTHADLPGDRSPNDPPHMRTMVRWPFQSIEGSASGNSANVIELSWRHNATSLSLGILVLGVLVGAWSWLTGPHPNDAVLGMAWSVSLGLTIAWFCLIVIREFTMGFGLTDFVVTGVLGAGAVGGVAYEIGSSFVGGSTKPMSGETTGPVAEGAMGRHQALTQGTNPLAPTFLSSTLGIATGFLLMIATAPVTNSYWGAAVGHLVLSGVQHAQDQTAVNISTGLATIAIGWIATAILGRLGAPRGFLWGLAFAATVLGVLLLTSSDHRI